MRETIIKKLNCDFFNYGIYFSVGVYGHDPSSQHVISSNEVSKKKYWKISHAKKVVDPQPFPNKIENPFLNNNILSF
jgi:hypothetical protein